MTPHLKSLIVQDFRSIRGRVEISLDAPMVLIHGPNGTGKTSLLSAIELALTRAVVSLERFDPGYIEHLPHKSAPGKSGYVSLSASGVPDKDTSELTISGSTIKGSGLLSPEAARFFVERCYLAQATLGRLLEIYEHQDTRKTDSPLTRFVKELLGLESLDALIEGLRSAGDVRRFRETAPLFWDARAEIPHLTAEVAKLRATEAVALQQLASYDATFREQAGELLPAADTAIDPVALRPQLTVLIQDNEGRLLELARRRRDLAGAADQVREVAASNIESGRGLAEAANTTSRNALDVWTSEFGEQLAILVRTIQAKFPDVPTSTVDAAVAHAAATAAVRSERDRLTKLSEVDASDGIALAEVQGSLRQGHARIKAIDEELADTKGASEELAQALMSVTSHIQGQDCPVCGRDFSEVSSQPLAVHVSEEVARLVTAAGRLQALIRDRNATSTAIAQAQRTEGEISARRFSQVRRDEVKVELARLEEWSNDLDRLNVHATIGSDMQRAAMLAAQNLAELNSRESAVIGLRAQVEQYATELSVSPPMMDAPLTETIASLLEEVERQEQRGATVKARRLLALESLEEITQLREQLENAQREFRLANESFQGIFTRKAISDRRIEMAKGLIAKATALRTDKVRRVFNDELNSIWRELFIRLAPEEAFIPAFSLPVSSSGPVEAVLETHYRSGGKGGNPRAMLSAGNLNTAALTLFLALHLSVKPSLPWLIIDDPVQSMDDVHIAQFAALLRTLKQKQRQVVIAVHDRQLFDYLALELSPSFNGDRLVTVELGRDADGKTTAPWDIKTYEPDRAIAAYAA